MHQNQGQTQVGAHAPPSFFFFFFFYFFLFFFFLSFEVDLAKIKHISMMMCYLTTEINRGCELLTKPNFKAGTDLGGSLGPLGPFKK